MSALSQEINDAVSEAIAPLVVEISQLKSVIKNETDGDLLTVAEVAQILQKTPKTVYTYINTGRLTATFVGKTARVKRADLNEFLS